MNQRLAARRKRLVILSALKRAAEMGAPCPSNPELGAIVGYSRDTVREAIQRFVDEGRINLEVRGSKRRVTIVDTGKSTAPIADRPEPYQRPRPPVEVRELVEIAARIFDTTEKDICSRARFIHIVRPRQAVFCVASRLGWGASHIARSIGIDNSSVHHARTNEKNYRQEPAFAAAWDAFEAEVAKLAA